MSARVAAMPILALPYPHSFGAKCAEMKLCLPVNLLVSDWTVESMSMQRLLGILQSSSCFNACYTLHRPCTDD